jgi:hypothetical protein
MTVGSWGQNDPSVKTDPCFAIKKFSIKTMRGLGKVRHKEGWEGIFSLEPILFPPSKFLKPTERLRNKITLLGSVGDNFFGRKGGNTDEIFDP